MLSLLENANQIKKMSYRKGFLDNCSIMLCYFSPQCKQFVDQYEQAIIEILVQELDPSMVCTALGLCASKKHQKGKGWQCSVIKMMSYLRLHLSFGDNDDLNTLCSVLNPKGPRLRPCPWSFFKIFLCLLSVEIRKALERFCLDFPLYGIVFIIKQPILDYVTKHG